RIERPGVAHVKGRNSALDAARTLYSESNGGSPSEPARCQAPVSSLLCPDDRRRRKAACGNCRPISSRSGSQRGCGKNNCARFGNSAARDHYLLSVVWHVLI